MDTFLKFMAVSFGLFIATVVATALIGVVVHKLTAAAKEVIDYYLQKKKEVIAEMEEEFAQGATRKDFGSH